MKLFYCLLVSGILCTLSCGINKSGVTSTNGDPISFSLTNDSAESIPLLIPGVMNPNLSPFSRSGVTLKTGQQILFRHRGKSRVLLVVDSTIEDGSTIEISKLLEQKLIELKKQSE